MIRRLDPVVPPAAGKPTRVEAGQTQEWSRALAADPSLWSAEAARQTVQRYTELAPVWDGERGSYRSVPLADALARGGPFPPGVCVEVGSGTGLLTPLLAAVWPRVLCVELTWEMLRRSPARARVLADAADLPVARGVAAAVVLADVPLFAREVTRIQAAAGVVIWSNALGRDAPHHVPIDDVLGALAGESGSTVWDAVTSEAGWGLWAVLRRRSPATAGAGCW